MARTLSINMGKEVKKQSQSKRMRNLIYHIWANINTELTEEEYYKMRTEKMVKSLQDELRMLTEPPIESYEK